eukprot:TRINITY_DN233_c0_g1_i3.p1 TRINITY_DN233_c0_g1~~TRINITY_DN233_c0_g1_i3.p1  ORF type:complete len:100 (+),score=13.01 TRINITY_DN233_c0_g1_i3:172-471(+)
MDVPKSRAVAHCVYTCKMCKRQSQGSIVWSRPHDSLGEVDFPMACFDFRGLEPIEWLPISPFSVKSSVSDTVFEDVDLSEGEWAEFETESLTLSGKLLA